MLCSKCDVCLCFCRGNELSLQLSWKINMAEKLLFNLFITVHNGKIKMTIVLFFHHDMYCLGEPVLHIG